MSSITVYQADMAGFFLYDVKAYELALQEGEYNIPFMALRAAPKDAPPGYVNRVAGDDWVVVEDHREDVLYYVKTPATEDKPALIERYQMASVVAVDGQNVSFDGGGPIPSWLTSVAPEPAEGSETQPAIA